MNTSETPQNKCPYCGYRTDRATCAEGDAVPSPQDVSVCINCGNVTIFTEELTLRMATHEEMDELRADAGKWRLVRTIQQKLQDIEAR